MLWLLDVNIGLKMQFADKKSEFLVSAFSDSLQIDLPNAKGCSVRLPFTLAVTQ